MFTGHRTSVVFYIQRARQVERGDTLCSMNPKENMNALLGYWPVRKGRLEQFNTLGIQTGTDT